MKIVTLRAPVDDVPTTDSFRDELRIRVRNLTASSSLSFRELVVAMEGAYPTDVQDALHSLQAEDVAVGGLRSDADSAETRTRLRSEADVVTLPEPHPLDYDWRFTEESLNSLAATIAETGAKRVAILGAPTVFLRLARADVDVTLYDNNVHLVEELRSRQFSKAVHCDLFTTRFEDPAFDLVVADPPWYPEHYTSFIRRAGELIKPGGSLLLSVLPRLTRPSASRDRMEILRDAEAHGFDLVAIHPSYLTYRSPPFEQSSLHAEGIRLEDWRRGDLFTFIRSTRPCCAGKEIYEFEDASLWQSFSVGRTIVRIRHRESDDREVTFRAVSPTGDVHLHSVSRRAPFRKTIDVWSSRNLALRLSRPDYLCDILRRHMNGESFGEAVSTVAIENHASAASRNALREIVDLILEDAGIVDNG